MGTSASHTLDKCYVAIIEDDSSLCRALARLLQASGCHPITYQSAEAFLGDAEQPAFDCLIVDIQMGGMSGISLAKYLSEAGSAVPLIFLTAHEDWAELKQTITTPYAALLRKTDPGDVVLAAVESAITMSGDEKSAATTKRKFDKCRE